jgi:hypothetical protein
MEGNEEERTHALRALRESRRKAWSWFATVEAAELAEFKRFFGELSESDVKFLRESDRMTQGVNHG